MKTKTIAKIANKSILLGIVIILNSFLVSAATLIESINSMINSGNTFQIVLGRLIITAIISLPLIIIQMYAKDIWGKFAINAFSVIYVIVAFYASSLVNNLTVASWVAWGATLLAGFMAMKKSRQDHWSYSSDMKLNPITIGLMVGLISMFVAPFNSLITGSFFPALTGTGEELLKALFASPLMWPLLGFLFGTIGNFISSKTEKASDVRDDWENGFEETQKNVNQDITQLDNAVKTNEQETELAQGIGEGLDKIGEELESEDTNNAGIEGEAARIRDEAASLGKLKTEDVGFSTPKIDEINAITNTILNHDQKIMKIAVDALKHRTDESKKSEIEKAEDYLEKMVEVIGQEKETGFWKEYKEMEKDDFKEIIDSFKQSDIEMMRHFAEPLEKNPEKYKNISNFLKLLKKWKEEFEKEKQEMKKVVKPTAKKLIEETDEIKKTITEIQKKINEINERKKALISHEKVYSIDKKQILDYIGLVANTNYPKDQRKKTEQALKQRIDRMVALHKHRDLELKEIKELIMDTKTLVHKLADQIKSSDHERKILLSMLKNEIGAKKTKKLGEVIYFNPKEDLKKSTEIMRKKSPNENIASAASR